MNRLIPRILSAALALFTLAMPAAAGRLMEPRLTLPPTVRQQPHLALTLDACSGKADGRVLKALIDNRIPATIFVTEKWLRRNPTTIATLLGHPDLFQIENHGARHLPALDHPGTVFGLPAAGSSGAIKREVDDGAEAIRKVTGTLPGWYRGATGLYSPSALALIAGLHVKVAGYSLKADDGASLPARSVARRLAAAKDGDVIIAHVNHPERSAGEGLVTGLLALKSRGYVFVKLGPAQVSPRPLGPPPLNLSN